MGLRPRARVGAPLKVFCMRGILSTPACDVHVRMKTNGTAIKIAKETTNNQDKKYNSVKHLQRQQLLFTKTTIESQVFLKILTVM